MIILQKKWKKQVQSNDKTKEIRKWKNRKGIGAQQRDKVAQYLDDTTCHFDVLRSWFSILKKSPSNQCNKEIVTIVTRIQHLIGDNDNKDEKKGREETKQE